MGFPFETWHLLSWDMGCSLLGCCLSLGFLLLWSDTMATATIITKTFELGFRCLVHDHHGRKHRHVQADVVLELRVLCLIGNRKLIDSNTEESLSKTDLKACPDSDLLPQERPHTYFMSRSNSAAPFAGGGGRFLLNHHRHCSLTRSLWGDLTLERQSFSASPWGALCNRILGPYQRNKEQSTSTWCIFFFLLCPPLSLFPSCFFKKKIF